MNKLIALKVGKELYHIMRGTEEKHILVMTIGREDPVSMRCDPRALTRWVMYDVDGVWLDEDESRVDLMERYEISFNWDDI